MNKLSANSDPMIASLPPKSFPVINLTNFKLSGSSVSSDNSRTPFPDLSNLKFVSKQKPMPNLFQYNDRNKLILSSDQQQEHQPSFSFQDKSEKANIKEVFEGGNIETIKKSKSGFLKELSQKKQQKVQPEQIKSSQPQRKKIQNKNVALIEQSNQEKEQEKEEIIFTKTYKIKGQGKGKNRMMSSDYSNEQIKGVLSQKNSEQPSFQHQEKAFNNYEREERQTFSHLMKNIKEEQINEGEQTIKKRQVDRQVPKQDLTVIQEQSNSNTSQILEQIQSEKQTIIAVSESERRLDTIRSHHQAENITPRKRKRNKIFDNSSHRRQASYLPFQRRLTPEKGVQTIQKQQKSVQCEQQVNRDLFPQIKALNILQKLVNQIDCQKVKPRTYNRAYQQQNSPKLSQISDFNKFFLSQIVAFQAISDIAEVSQNNYLQRMRILKEKTQQWSGKLANHEISILTQETVLRFNKLNELFQIIFAVYRKYKETVERLELFQKKLQDYVLILRTKDAKRLYLLRKQLNVQLQLLHQLRAGCGDTKCQKLFREYLSNELQLLKQIKEDIDGNFNNQLSILKF